MLSTNKGFDADLAIRSDLAVVGADVDNVSDIGDSTSHDTTTPLKSFNLNGFGEANDVTMPEEEEVVDSRDEKRTLGVWSDALGANLSRIRPFK